MHAWQSKSKTCQKISNIMREKRACKLCELSKVLHFPMVHWSLPGERPSLWVLPGWNPLDRHSYVDPRLGYMAPHKGEKKEKEEKRKIKSYEFHSQFYWWNYKLTITWITLKSLNMWQRGLFSGQITLISCLVIYTELPGDLGSGTLIKCQQPVHLSAIKIHSMLELSAVTEISTEIFVMTYDYE